MRLLTLGVLLALLALLAIPLLAQNTGQVLIFTNPAGLGITVAEDGGVSLGDTAQITFMNCTVAAGGAGEAQVTCSAGGGVEIREVDGSPAVSAVSVVEFLEASGFVVTDQGGGVARVDFVDTVNHLPVSQTSHGFSVGQWLMHSGATDSWALLDTSALTADHNAVGFVRSVEGTDDFTLAVGGSQPWAHGLGLGPLFASSTPGALTDTPPPLGAREWLVAVATSSAGILIIQREWSQL